MKSGDLNKANFDSAWSGVRTATYVQVLQWLYDYHPRDDETQAMLKEDMTLVSTLGDKRPNCMWTVKLRQYEGQAMCR